MIIQLHDQPDGIHKHLENTLLDISISSQEAFEIIVHPETYMQIVGERDKNFILNRLPTGDITFMHIPLSREEDFEQGKAMIRLRGKSYPFQNPNKIKSFW